MAVGGKLREEWSHSVERAQGGLIIPNRGGIRNTFSGAAVTDGKQS